MHGVHFDTGKGTEEVGEDVKAEVSAACLWVMPCTWASHAGRAAGEWEDLVGREGSHCFWS